MADGIFAVLKKQSKKIFKAFSSPAIIFFIIVGNSVFLLISSLVYIFEHNKNPMFNNFLDAIYWGVTTMTTVGYGDVVPITSFGKLFSVILMLSGTALFISFTGVLVSYLIKEEVEEELEPLENEIEEEEEIQLEIEKKLDDIINRLDRIEKT